MIVVTMPRNRIRKTNIGLHTEEQMSNALKLISDGRTIRSVAKSTAIPYTTLYRYHVKMHDKSPKATASIPSSTVAGTSTSIEKKFLSPFQLRGLPKAGPRKEGRAARRKGKSMIVTDTPNKDEIQMREEAAFEDEEDNNMTIDPDNFPALKGLPVEGDFILVEFEVKRKRIFYAAKVIGQKQNETEVSFLRKSDKTPNNFHMPNVPDIGTVPLHDIKMILPKPTFSGTTKRKQGVSARESYGDDAVGYVQLYRDNGICTVKCKMCPEHKVRTKAYNVTLIVNENDGEIISCECHDCAEDVNMQLPF
ncbi:hypothetical protein HW555_002901 [Spodoptera exigua]|uniref:HTH psq-type domain-containing protein n=1 Tax=Spodoptera exigua TaxID=7107 RepID=A0A835L9R1_SPOEX|nr:hypothetical protein HW555_002901 [Spodoptera exigua]